MYGSRNPVIFLHRLGGECIYCNNSLELYFEKLQMQVGNIYIPETKEELKEILQLLVNGKTTEIVDKR